MFTGVNEEEISRSSWLVGQWAEHWLTTEAVFSPDLVYGFHLVGSGITLSKGDFYFLVHNIEFPSGSLVKKGFLFCSLVKKGSCSVPWSRVQIYRLA